MRLRLLRYRLPSEARQPLRLDFLKNSIFITFLTKISEAIFGGYSPKGYTPRSPVFLRLCGVSKSEFMRFNLINPFL